MLTNRGAPHSCGMKYRLQGTGPLANISEKFCFHNHFTIVKRKVLFKVLARFFGYATLIKQRLFDGLL